MAYCPMVNDKVCMKKDCMWWVLHPKDSVHGEYICAINGILSEVFELRKWLLIMGRGSKCGGS